MPANPLVPLAPERWTSVHARHLLNRAGFGVPEERVAALAAMTPKEAVASLIDIPGRTGPEPAPGFVVPVEEAFGYRRELRGLPDEERRKKQQEHQRREREAVQELTAWWVERMSVSEHPLEEKMTLFWQGHFATSAQKIKASSSVYHYNDTLRRHALGDIKALAIAVGQSPAMLVYLDNARSTKAKPNENWARELMELFTMGQGAYTERDIKESARAFTGWAFNQNGFIYRENQHDFGEKTFLGQSGPFDGWDVIDIIFEQPATSRFLSRKLLTYFVQEDPAETLVEAFAESLRANGYVLKPSLAALFESEAFYSEAAMGGLIKSPAHFVTQLAHDLQLDPLPVSHMTRAMAGLGQNPFMPPNVKGWDGGRAWINANTLLTRYNLPVQLASAAAERGTRKTMNASMTGESPEAMTGADGETMMTGGESMKPAQRKQAANKGAMVRAMMRSLSPEDRAAWTEKFQGAQSEAEREKLALALHMKVNPEGVWRPEFVLAGLEFENAGQCVDALVARFLVRKPQAQQRAVLIKALGAESAEAPLVFDDLPPENMNAALHLLFSMAEYQLC